MAQAQKSEPHSITQQRADEGGLSQEEIFEILSNTRRRYVLQYIKQRPDTDTFGLREIVSQVAAWENDKPVETVETNERKTVYTSLMQTHLPRLDEFGVISYDRQRSEITATDSLERVQVYMEYVPEEDISWGQYYFLLSGICGLIATGAWTGLPLLDSADGLPLAGLFIVVFAVSSVVHLYKSRQNQLGSEYVIKRLYDN
jgi:hypothetical protein